MKALVVALGLGASGALFYGWRSLEGEREELLERRSELQEAASRREEALEDDRRRGDVVARAAELPGGALELAVLRELLIDAEHGLGLDRIFLDFRPEPTRPAEGVGGTITASMRGSFDALYEYLGRVERLRLPLTAGEMSLRPDADGRLLLNVRYRALWELEAGDAPVELAPADVARLERWLSRDGQGPPGRNPFTERAAAPSSPSEPAPPPSGPTEPVESAAPPPPGLPRLSGYVLARPELEADVNARVLAAIRYEGELRLLKVGDTIGPFRVEGIAARESVVLVDSRTGERLTLFLE